MALDSMTEEKKMNFPKNIVPAMEFDEPPKIVMDSKKLAPIKNFNRAKTKSALKH
jgi:hypothetical protein